MTRSLLVSFVVLAVLGVFTAVDPFHLRHGPLYAGVTVLLALVTGTSLAVRVLPGRLLRVVSGVVGGLLVVGWLGLAWLTLAFAGPEPEQVVGDGGREGRVEAVVVRGHAFDETVFSVRLRAGGGPFAQESVVWQGLGDAPPPVRTSVSDRQEVRVVTVAGCGYRSTFDPTTLAVEPVHYALRPDGC